MGEIVSKTSEDINKEPIDETKSVKFNEKVEVQSTVNEGTISEEDKHSTPKEKEQYDREQNTTSTKKRISRLVTSKIPLRITQPIVYRPSTRCSSVTMTPNLEERRSADKLFRKATINECGTCTEFSLNSLEKSHVYTINIGYPNKPIKKKVKSVAKENLQDNFMIGEESYKLRMKEAMRKRKKQCNEPSIPINQFKQTFLERLNMINNTLSQRYMSEIEFHKNALRRIPESISTPRIKLLDYWVKDLVNKQEEAFYKP